MSNIAYSRSALITHDGDRSDVYVVEYRRTLRSLMNSRLSANFAAGSGDRRVVGPFKATDRDEIDAMVHHNAPLPEMNASRLVLERGFNMFFTWNTCQHCGEYSHIGECRKQMLQVYIPTDIIDVLKKEGQPITESIVSILRDAIDSGRTGAVAEVSA